MAEEYRLNYVSDNSDILAKTAQVMADLRRLDALAIQVRASLRGAFQGQSAPIGAVARAVARVNAGLNAMPGNAGRAATALNAVGGASAGAAKGAGRLTTALGGIGGTIVGLNAVARVAREIGDALKDARTYARELGDANRAMKDDLRESANLAGKPRPDNAVAADALDLMLQAGFKSAAESRRFSNEFRGAIFAARAKGHIAPLRGTPAQLERDMEVEAARLAVAKQIDPRTAARLAAGIATTSPIRDRRVVGAQLGLTVEALNEGVGTLGELTDQVMRARGSMIASGYAQSVPDVAAMVAGMSVNNPVGRIATRIESMATALSKATAGAHAPHLAKLGITAGDRDFIGALRKLKPVIDKANEPGGEGAIAALAKLGIKDARATQEFIKSVGELPFYEKLIARNRAVLGDASRGIAPDARRAIEVDRKLTADLDAFRDADATGRFADARMASAEFLRGLRTERLQVLRRGSAADLIAGEKIRTAPAKVEAMIREGFGLQTVTGGKTDEEMLVDHEVARRLIERAHKAGISDATIKAKVPDLADAASGTRGSNAHVGEERLGLSVELLESMIGGRAGGGDVIKDAKARQRGETIEARIKALREAADAQAPGGVPVRPPGPARHPAPGTAAPGAPLHPPIKGAWNAPARRDELVPLVRELVAFERQKAMERRMGGFDDGGHLPFDDGGGGPLRV